MNRKLRQKLNNTLGRTCGAETSPSAKSALQNRLSEELDWMDACPGRESLVILLNELAARIRSIGIVVSLGYGNLPGSLLLYLTGVTCINPVRWNLPFIIFTETVRDGLEIVFEAGSGSLGAASEFLSNREGEFVTETEPGIFDIDFLDGELLQGLRLTILENADLDGFGHTLKTGWHSLTQSSLSRFRCGDTKGVIYFDSDRMREMLSEFGPESFSDLVLLNALSCPERNGLYEKVLAAKNEPATISGSGYATSGLVLDESYGIPVYKEQATLLSANQGLHDIPMYQHLAQKSHFIGRTILSVESMWQKAVCRTTLA